MKGKLLLFAAAALSLAACQKNSQVEVSSANDGAIGFGAYTTTSAVTKGSVVAPGDIYGTSKPGIGIFAFYEPKATGDFNTYKYTTPDFMYNEQVTSTDGTSWTYSPLKYWPNNDGDKLSFFAYAPYDQAKTWEDLGIKTDVNNKNLTVSFPVASVANDQQDQLWAAPQLNLTKPSVSEKVNFAFTHVTSQVNLYVGVETDVATHTPGAWGDATTSIEIKSIEFKDLSSSMTYTYTLPISGDPAKSYGDKQNVKLTGDDFEDAAKLINTTNYATAGFKLLNKSTSVMFLVPEQLSSAVVTYTVTTNDANLTDGKSVITNTVICDLSSITMVAQKVYNLQFLIGMTSVKVSASVDDWDSPAVGEQINAPVVNYKGQLYKGYTITVNSEDETKGTVSSTLSGSILTLTATPNFGYLLNKWVDEDGATVSNPSSVDLSSPEITKDKTYIAKFKGDVLLSGEFSVASGKTVKFTKGNLYYSSTDNAFHIEADQNVTYVTLGQSAYDATHVCHFYWTKTAAASYAESYNDGTCTTTDNFFADGSDADHSLTIEGQEGLYALSSGNWTYLLQTRTNASNLYKSGVTVTDGAKSYTNCLIIAPDDFTGTLASSYTLDKVNASGLVCLPPAGNRDGSSLSDGGSTGSYWSSSQAGIENSAFRLYILNGGRVPFYSAISANRSRGYSVRLVFAAQ